jgi:hypothetical protein
VHERSGHLVRRFTEAEDEQILVLKERGLTNAAIGRRLKRAPHSILGRLMTLARQDARRDGE